MTDGMASARPGQSVQLAAVALQIHSTSTVWMWKVSLALIEQTPVPHFGFPHSHQFGSWISDELDLGTGAQAAWMVGQ